jgi:hypothetical protein
MDLRDLNENKMKFTFLLRQIDNNSRFKAYFHRFLMSLNFLFQCICHTLLQMLSNFQNKA